MPDGVPFMPAHPAMDANHTDARGGYPDTGLLTRVEKLIISGSHRAARRDQADRTREGPAATAWAHYTTNAGGSVMLLADVITVPPVAF